MAIILNKNVNVFFMKLTHTCKTFAMMEEGTLQKFGRFSFFLLINEDGPLKKAKNKIILALLLCIAIRMILAVTR